VALAGADLQTALAVSADLDAFWAAELAPLAFEPVGPVVPVRPSVGAGSCDGVPLSVEQVAGNAYFCRPERVVGLDVEGLGVRLAQIGGFAVALLVAHEWGHAVQQSRGVRPSTTPAIELEADCFAGVWAQAVIAGRRMAYRATPPDVDQALAAFVVVRHNDAVGGANHGTAFDRVNAFEDGMTGGTAACIAYDQTPPVPVSLPVVPADVDGTGLPLQQLLTLSPALLEEFWSGVVGAPVVATALAAEADTRCAGRTVPLETRAAGVWLCAEEQTVRWDAAGLAEVAAGLGDFAVQLRLLQVWAAAVAAGQGWVVTSGAVPPGAGGLAADCLAGVWARDAAAPPPQVPGEAGPGRYQLGLSGNDLDELVAGLLATPAAAGGPAAAERVEAFRMGFSGDIAVCGQRYPAR
jgi:predicted metalloprotease